MIALNLTANGMEQNLIKEFLQNNVNDVLANKINNGVKITKNNTTLINKKTLDGFMSYAYEQAKKSAEKNARFACLHHDTVFGWAMHYFEEDDIEGTLYCEDGTEYKPAIKTPTKVVSTPTTTYTPPVKKPNPQMSLFDLMSTKTEPKQEIEIDETPTDDDMQEAMEELNKEINIEQKEKPVSPIYTKYFDTQKSYPDHVIAYRLGDFYEVFGDNAIKVSNKLDLTLTGRDFGLKERIPMIGFPYHASDMYFKKITEFSPLAIMEDNSVTIYDKLSSEYLVNMETGEVIPNDSNDKILQSLINIFKHNMEIKL